VEAVFWMSLVIDLEHILENITDARVTSALLWSKDCTGPTIINTLSPY